MATFIQGVSSHAQDRAAEYLGCNPEPEVWLALIASIGTPNATLMHVDPTGMQRWRLVLDEQSIELIWNPINQVIVTMLCPGSRHSDHYARKLPRNGMGRATRSETHMVRLRGKPLRLRKVWR